ncbi:PREDICTED: dynein intermediate chain 3, ciliary isoform X2 [Nicrophorus vespilloides]|uniref:Dynein intermediate chain 3, ciliary isoform X2 n=1 Tax=Nicrophorus vespilloides TaxID=110193 RepID=A0ABM1MK43_NICVS|nr:PREDICTED: dynein intermediate chain 3, ciliary isoform X2 [Nicrophorus vespilloides]
MDLTFPYEKKRSEFGKQCMFNDRGPELIDSCPSSLRVSVDFIRRNPVNTGVQNSKIQAEHEINTYRAEYSNALMNHVEGGWPKDVNIADEEQTKRYRRKVEKDESYAHIMQQLCKNMENCILQNNAINIYQQYYTDVEPTPLTEPCTARTVNVFQDQSSLKRPVTNMSWSPDGGSRVIVCHCNLVYQANIQSKHHHSYVWELENPNTPQMILNPPTQSVCIEYNQKDQNSLVSGQYNGQVAVWDVRRGNEPVDFSVMECSHRDPVNSILWINSKSGTEFFSGSTDGTLKWWDTRKMKDPLETLILDASKSEEQSISNALGCSILEYEHTIPTRFMVGTENGYVISCNRKGKAPNEKMMARYHTHYGPVLALQRNAAFVKNFLTVGDWTARIWSEDCKESAIMWTSYHKARLSDGAWSPTRYSVFYTARSDGILDVWDLLQDQHAATIGVKISDEPLTKLKTNEGGRLICVGNQIGTTYIIEFSDNLSYSNKNDKALLTAIFERETRREKILEARNREIRLKQRTARSSTQLAEEQVDTDDTSFEDPNVVAAEQEFFAIIERETKVEEEEEEEEEGQENLELLQGFDTEDEVKP